MIDYLSRSRHKTTRFPMLLNLVLIVTVLAEQEILYDESFARLAFDFAAASYAADPLECVQKNNATLIYKVKTPCDYLKNECWGLIAVDKDSIFISFRGTKSKEQLVTELVESIGRPKHKIHAGGSVHYYFYSALKALWKPMSHLVHAEMMKSQKKIIFTGHSLGGALASIASTMFAHKFPGESYRISLVTFGQPRVGNIEYALTHNRLVARSWRIVHKIDIVPHVPFCVESVAPPISCIPFFNHGSYHHGTEIWYPKNMTNGKYRVCTGRPMNEDNSCSNQHKAYDIEDHLTYFDHHVSDYGIDGCVDKL